MLSIEIIRSVRSTKKHTHKHIFGKSSGIYGMLLCTFFDYAFACVCILTLLYSSPACTHHTHISHQESFLSVPASYHLKQVVFSSNMRLCSHSPRLIPASKPTCRTSALALSLLFFVSSLHKLTREVVNLLRGLESVCICISFCVQG